MTKNVNATSYTWQCCVHTGHMENKQIKCREVVTQSANSQSECLQHCSSCLYSFSCSRVCFWRPASESAFTSISTYTFEGLFGFGGWPLPQCVSLGGGSLDAGWHMVSAGCSCLSLCMILQLISSSLSLPMTELVPFAYPQKHC